MALKQATFGVVGLFCLLTLSEAVPASRITTSGLYLQVYEAGKVDGMAGPKVEDGSAICPDMYPGGFTFFCKGVPEGTTLVYLSYNDRSTKTEKQAPYSLTGDVNGAARPFMNYGSGGILKCWTDTGASLEVSVTFNCDGGNSASVPADVESDSLDAEMMSPEPTMAPMDSATTDMMPESSTMPASDVPAMSTSGEMPQMEDPSEDDMTMMDKPTKEPTAMADDGEEMTMTEENANEPATEPVEPPAEDVIMTAPPAPEVAPPAPEVAPPAPEVVTEEAPSAPAKMTGKGCIVLSALRDFDRVAPGWVRQSNGLAYKPNTPGFKIERVPSSSSVVMKMKFTAPSNTRLAIAMDSTSGHGTEANDLFIRMTDPSLVLVAKDEAKSSIFMKAFQSSNGRDRRMRCRADTKLPNGLRRHGDSISTGMLTAGREYTLEIAGRSNRFILHNIVMWPCSGRDCKDLSQAWLDMVDVCRPF